MSCKRHLDWSDYVLHTVRAIATFPYFFLDTGTGLGHYKPRRTIPRLTLENGEYMSIRKLRLAAFSAFAMVLMGALHQASAAVVYTYIAEKPTYTVQPNSTVVVNVYLQELTSAGSGSFLATDGGLAGFGTAVAQSSNGLPASPSKLTAAAANATDFTVFNTAAYNFVDITGASGQIAGAINGVGGAAGIQVNNSGGSTAPAKANAVYLGNFTITAGPSGTTQFTLGAIDFVNGQNTLTKNSVYDIDLQQDQNGATTNLFTGVGTNLTTFSVSVAPEPASLGLLAFGGLLALRRRRA